MNLKTNCLQLSTYRSKKKEEEEEEEEVEEEGGRGGEKEKKRRRRRKKMKNPYGIYGTPSRHIIYTL